MTGTVAFLALLAVTVAAWAITWRRDRRAAARAEAIARHPSRVPGLPVDGEPLTEAELNEYTGILLSPVREPKAKHGSPPAEGKQR